MFTCTVLGVPLIPVKVDFFILGWGVRFIGIPRTHTSAAAAAG
jgi:hypothetical protein